MMEFVQGKPITEYADQMGLSIHDRLDLFLAACEAIEHSHHQLVVHLDLKPGNILVDRDGVVKVIDFGVARQIEGREAAESSGAFSGPYASPEQIQAGSLVGYPADIYALGAVLYELLCEHEPFDPLLVSGELERQIVEETPRPPSVALNQSKLKMSDAGTHFRLEAADIAKMRGGCRVSEARMLIAGDLDRICLFALRKKPARRYTSVDDLHSDVKAVLDGRKPRIARSGDPLYSAVRAARRKQLEVVAGVMAVTGTLTAVGFLALFSAGIRASRESARVFEDIAGPTLKELREDLRPKLTAHSRSAAGLEVLDTALHAATPVRRVRTFGEKVWEDLVLQIRTITGTMPEDDLRSLP